MANSSTHIDGIISSQASKEVTANAFFDAASPATLYGRRQSQCSGLTWAYYGGNVTRSDNTLAQIGNGTLALTASATNYIVAKKEDGAVTASTATTNWNSADYWRLYSVSTAAAAVSSYTDSREIGRMTGAGSGMTAPVTKTGNFTLAATENAVICNGSALDHGDAAGGLRVRRQGWSFLRPSPPIPWFRRRRTSFPSTLLPPEPPSSQRRQESGRSWLATGQTGS
jgi:hypothetical protein